MKRQRSHYDRRSGRRTSQILSGGQLALVETMDNICTSVRTTAAAAVLLLQLLHAEMFIFAALITKLAVR